MLAITHTLASIPFGIYLQNPIYIFLSAMAMHFVLDSILHWNIQIEKNKRYPYEHVTIDVLGGISIGWLMLGNQIFTPNILIAIAGGLAPDILHGLWFITKRKTRKRYLKWLNAPFTFHEKIQNETPNVIKGMVWQIVVIAIAIGAIVVGI